MSGIGPSGWGRPFRSSVRPGVASSSGSSHRDAGPADGLELRHAGPADLRRFECRRVASPGRTALEAEVCQLSQRLGLPGLLYLGCAARVAETEAGHPGKDAADWWKRRTPEIQSTADQIDALRALPVLIEQLKTMRAEIEKAADGVQTLAGKQLSPALRNLSASLRTLLAWMENPSLHRGVSPDNGAFNKVRESLLSRLTPSAGDGRIALAEDHGTVHAAWQTALQTLATTALNDAPGPERNRQIAQAMRQLAQARAGAIPAARDPCLPRFVRAASVFMDRQDPAFVKRLHDMCATALGKREPDLAEIAAVWARPSERLLELNAALPGLMGDLDGTQRDKLIAQLGTLAGRLGSTQLLDANRSDVVERARQVSESLEAGFLDDPRMLWLSTQGGANHVVERLAASQGGSSSLGPAWRLLNQASDLRRLGAQREPFLAFMHRVVEDQRQLLPAEYQHGILKAVLQQLPDARLGESRDRMLDLIEAGINGRLNSHQRANLLAQLAGTLPDLPAGLRDGAMRVLTRNLEPAVLSHLHARPLFDMLLYSLQRPPAGSTSRLDTPGCVLEPTHGLFSTTPPKRLQSATDPGTASSAQEMLFRSMTRYLGRTLQLSDLRQRPQDSLLPVAGQYIAAGVASPPGPLALCAAEALCMAMPLRQNAAHRQQWLEAALGQAHAHGGRSLVGDRFRSLLDALCQATQAGGRTPAHDPDAARLAAVRMIRCLDHGGVPQALRRSVNSALLDTVWNASRSTADTGRVALAMLEDAEADQRPMDDAMSARFMRVAAACFSSLSPDESIRAMPVVLRGFHWLDANGQAQLKAMLERHQTGGRVAERSVNAAIANLCQFQGEDARPLLGILRPMFDRLADDNKAAVLGDLFDQVAESAHGLPVALEFMKHLERGHLASGLSALLRTVLTDRETVDALPGGLISLATQAVVDGLEKLDARQVADLEREAVRYSDEFPDSPALRAFAEFRRHAPAD